ncbi:MAG: hypothetical protein IJX82_05190 [Clostridia bacterium]|nr:hypothetical protein [Clostridia bacterium]
MKKKYVSPELEILLLELTDIITTSPVGGDNSGDLGPGDNFEDEWD